MVGEPTGYQPRTVYGPFHRLEAELTQDAATAVRQLLNGEVWGRCEPFGLLPKVKAYRGPLRNGDSGIEFWETAKLSVAFVRVTQDLLEALP